MKRSLTIFAMAMAVLVSATGTTWADLRTEVCNKQCIDNADQRVKQCPGLVGGSHLNPGGVDPKLAKEFFSCQEKILREREQCRKVCSN
jgi:hypothetical protein